MGRDLKGSSGGAHHFDSHMNLIVQVFIHSVIVCLCVHFQGASSIKCSKIKVLLCLLPNSFCTPLLLFLLCLEFSTLS